MAFVDRDLTCAECGAQFVFSAGEQQFFKDKGFLNDPKRCKQCKTQVGRRPLVESHVECAQCGKQTTVPFKPRRGKPVYCSECFKSSRVVPDLAE